MIEYLIYGNYPDDNSTLESLLIETDLRPEAAGQPITNRAVADFHLSVLENKGFKNLRLATYDGSPPNFNTTKLLNV